MGAGPLASNVTLPTSDWRPDPDHLRPPESMRTPAQGRRNVSKEHAALRHYARGAAGERDCKPEALSWPYRVRSARALAKRGSRQVVASSARSVASATCCRV